MSDQRDTWEEFLRLERAAVQECADGRLARALGPALPGESQEELDRLVEEDVRLAGEGLVELRRGEEVWYRHVEELTREERPAMIEAEMSWQRWLKGRVEKVKKRNQGEEEAHYS